MNCTRCGRPVDEGTVLCPFCGKTVSNAPTAQAEWTARRVIFPVGMILFLFFSFDLIPGTMEGAYAYFAIFASAIVLLSGALWFFLKNRHTKKAVAVLWLVPLILLLSTVSLRVVYYAKYQEVAANIPSSGMVAVRFSYDEMYYSDVGGELITNDEAWISVEGKRLANNGIARIELFKSIAVSGSSEFNANVNRYTSNGSVNVVLTPSLLKQGRTFEFWSETDTGQACKFNVTAQYAPEFWDVIRY